MEIIVRVVEQLGPLIRKEVELHLNSDQEAKSLADNLEKIQLLLDDAESQQLSRPLVKKWLEDLQNLAYDVEDALEDWKAQNEALQQQEESINSSPATTWMEKVCHFLHYPCSCFNKVVERRTVALDINGLNQSVVGMYTQGVDQLKLIQLLTSLASPYKAESVGSSSSYNWRSTTSDFIKSEVHGREKDAENVKKMLLSDNSRENHEVICIVGSGGLGKTTLAKMMYAHDEVTSKFPQRILVCVSDPFNELAIVRTIYEQLERRSPSVSELEAIKNEIKESLQRKSSQRFLLVLDDVWTEKSEKWKPLQACLSHGAKGSKILVTTRKANTAKAVGATKSSTYFLEKMSPEDCWSIIRQKAFEGDESNPRLEKIGKEIAKKCDGSPLAAIFLGGHLQDKTTEQEWKRVQESEVWKLENVENDLFRHLFLSYNELKPAVKRCFAYCAVFPKDHEIEVHNLVKLWKVQGFASSTNASLATEHDCFKNLAQRSFFQDLEKFELTGEILICKMHDIVHDFAQYLNKNARHVWWDHKLQQSISISDVEKLRSFYCRGGLPTKDIIGRLKSIRALSLYDCRLEKIQEEIGNLIHLRHLTLTGNNMTELPETICKLCNLQVLMIWRCEKLSKLPKGIFKLRNLRYLLCDKENFDYTCEIASLTDLHQLQVFYVGGGCNDLRYLKDLNQLGGNLVITLSNVDDVESAETAALWKKTYLDMLYLEYNERVKLKVVDALKPHPQLQNLIISSSCTLRFPSWISALEYLRSLVILGVKIEKDSRFDWIFTLKSIKSELFVYKKICETAEDHRNYCNHFLKYYIPELEHLFSKIYLENFQRLENRIFPYPIFFLENLRSLCTNLGNVTVLENLIYEITLFEIIFRAIVEDITDFPPLWKLPCLEYLRISGDYCTRSFVSSLTLEMASSLSDDKIMILFPALKKLELEDDSEITILTEEEFCIITGRTDNLPMHESGESSRAHTASTSSSPHSSHSFLSQIGAHHLWMLEIAELIIS